MLLLLSGLLYLSILSVISIYYFSGIYEISIYSPYPCTTHALLLQFHPNVHSLLLDKTVQDCAPTGTWKPAPPTQFLCIFDLFDSSLPACLPPEMLCSVLTSPLFFPISVQAFPIFPSVSPVTLQGVLPGAPNLPNSNPSSQPEPLSQLSSPCVTPTPSPPLEHHSCPGLPQSPASASNRV